MWLLILSSTLLDQAQLFYNFGNIILIINMRWFLLGTSKHRHKNCYWCLKSISRNHLTLLFVFSKDTIMDTVSGEVLGPFCFLCYLFGAFGTVKIIKHLLSTNFDNRPLNILTLIDEVIYFSLMTFASANILIMIWAGMKPIDFFRQFFFVEIDEQVLNIFKMVNIIFSYNDLPIWKESFCSYIIHLTT